MLTDTSVLLVCVFSTLCGGFSLAMAAGALGRILERRKRRKDGGG